MTRICSVRISARLLAILTDIFREFPQSFHANVNSIFNVICLFIYSGLFNGAVSSSDYIGTNDGLIGE
jgi:hypothetical protein